MNIHIDKELHDQLNKRTLFRVEFGSYLYGLENADSDKDILNIYYLTPQEQTSILSSLNHQLQYKNNNIDYIHTDLFQFFRNILNGDSTVNFELMHTKEFQMIFNLNIPVENFYTYNMVKCYLGLVKRDLKEAHKQEDSYRMKKKLKHAYRGLLFAQTIFEKKPLKLHIKDYPESVQNNFALLDSTDNLILLADIINDVYTHMEDLRLELNVALEEGKIIKYMDPIIHRDLDNRLFEINFKNIKNNEESLNLQIVREALESGIKY